MKYQDHTLELHTNGVRDTHGEIRCEDIPSGDSGCNTQLVDHASPFMKSLWQRALADVMSNHISIKGTSYLGAGAKFGAKVFTRDIAYSGILGVNRTHPELMRNSLRFTRELRLELGLKVPLDYDARDKGIPCQVIDMDTKSFTNQFRTNCYLRRTDDVIWLWAYHDLIKNDMNDEELTWLYVTGQRCFKELYDPFFDEEDGLYYGQASFIDVHFPDKKKKATGYPHHWDFADCIRIKATCTNALYQRGLQVMADTAQSVDCPSANEWKERATAHRECMKNQLRDSEGRFLYYKLPDGTLEPRRAALGSALAVLAGVVSSGEAVATLEDYPHTPFGIPLIHPARSGAEFDYYHNTASWPFVDALFCWAEAMATGKDTSAYAAAIAARTCRPDGTFHEVVRLPDGDVRCSSSQLWSAAGFINVCLRSGLVKGLTI